jgi:outer membrane protein assembly factor BamD (BamD/ComL family)
MNRRRTARTIEALAALVLLAILVSCRTTGPVDLAGLTPAEIFQRAQDASDKGEYRRAISYYEGFLAQAGIVDAQRAAWARYEAALLYHKMGDDDTALAKLDELLAMYAKDPTLPEGAKVLASGIRADILERRAK